MSEKKKAFVETSYDGADEGTSAPAKPPIREDIAGAKRQRAQNVLPDILGKQLRAAYGELLNDPIPDRFNDLIKKLEHCEAKEAKPVTSQDEEASQ